MYVIDIPLQGPGQCWYVESDREFCNAIRDYACRVSADTVWEKLSVAEMLVGYAMSLEEIQEEADADEEWAAEVVALARDHGMDTPLYRGWGQESWSVAPLDEMQCCVAWSAHDSHRFCILADGDVAGVLEGGSDALVGWSSIDRDRARAALRKAVDGGD